MKKMITMAVFALVLGISAKAFGASLVDVPSGHWAEDAVQKLIDSGLIEGYPDGTYKGDRPMSRYEYAMVIARLLDALDKKYCTVDKCKVTAAGSTTTVGGTVEISAADLEALKSTIQKLAYEFKDELAAMNVKIDDHEKRISVLEQGKGGGGSVLGNLKISGSLRQRIDAPSTELDNAKFSSFYRMQYLGKSPFDATAGLVPTSLKGGYQMYPTITITGNVAPNAKVNLKLSTYLDNLAGIGPAHSAGVAGNNQPSSLGIDYANVELDFSSDVKELDSLKVIAGYQNLVLGPLGMLADDTGITSNPGVLVAMSKDAVSVAAVAALGNSPLGTNIPGLGMDTTNRDAFLGARVGLDLKRAQLGFNFLASGYLEEKGWSGDVAVKLLQDSPFLTAFRGEYLTLTDSAAGAWPTKVNGWNGTIAVAPKDYAFTMFLDAYKSKRASLTVGYADTPAVPTFSSLDENPFSEYDSNCALGSDYNSGMCFTGSNENGRMLFPGGFKGLGVEASYKVFGNVTLAGRGVIGDYAGGAQYRRVNNAWVWGSARGLSYPSYGAISVSKPVNNSTTFSVEYMQQGKNPIMLNRVRGELLINF